MGKAVDELLAEEALEETPNTADPQEVNKQRKKYARKRSDRLRFIEAAMSHEEGRAWFYDTLVFCQIFQNPYDTDPYKTAFLCGQRNVGLRILADIQDAAPDEYLKMIKESKTKNG